MEQLELKVEQRSELGSAEMKRLRSRGEVPAVIYAAGEPAVALKMNTHDFVLTVRDCPPAQLFKLNSSNKELNGKIVLVKELQIEPLKDHLLHVDFQAVKEGQMITVKIPVKITGESPAVREGRAMLNQITYELEVDCIPTNIPDSVSVDVSELESGETLFASLIELPADVKLRSTPDTVIVSALSAKRLAAEEEAAATPAEGEEGEVPADGEAAAGEDGAAAAEGGADGGGAEKKGGD